MFCMGGNSSTWKISSQSRIYFNSLAGKFVFAAQSLIGCDICCSFSDWLWNLLLNLWLAVKFCVHSLIGWGICCSISAYLGKFAAQSLIGCEILCSFSDWLEEFAAQSLISWEIWCLIYDWLGNLVLNLWLEDSILHHRQWIPVK